MATREPTITQRKFAAGIAAGKSKAEAYRLSHPNQRMQLNSLRTAAQRASKRPAVIAEVQRLWSQPVVLEQFPEANDARILREHALATMTRLTQYPDPVIQMHAARWLFDYASTLESRPETDRQSLMSDLRGLYKKALHQTPLIETVVENETAASEPAEL